MILRYASDTLGVVIFISWFCYGFDSLGMERLFGVSGGLAWKKETETSPTVRFWYNFDMILIFVFNTVPRNPTKLSPYKTSKTQPAITALTHIDPYQNHSWNRNHIKIMTAKQGHKQIITIKHVWIAPKSPKITNLQKPSILEAADVKRLVFSELKLSSWIVYSISRACYNCD